MNSLCYTVEMGKSDIYRIFLLVFINFEIVHGSLADLHKLMQVDPAFSIKFPGNQKFLEKFEGADLVGHLQQLGKQRPPLGQIPEYFKAPSPRFLWDHHVKLYRPALFRGLLNDSPANSLWADDYLTTEYGDLEVLVEKKYEDRKSEPKRMTIRAFLEEYQNRNWYVVSVLPNAMKKDVKIPKPLMCGTFSKNLQELNLWIGTHGTRSMLHYDADNILHCLVAGRKDWILIHPRNKFRTDMAIDNPGQGSGLSLLDVDGIDLYNNPDVADIPWEYASLYPGDCIYLPPQYMHQVRSFNRSISTTFLFYPNHQFTDHDCSDVDLESYRSLEGSFVYWGYEKGQETVDMGYANPVQARTIYLAVCDTLRLESLTWERFLYTLSIFGSEILNQLPMTREIFDQFDSNKDELVSHNELLNADIEPWKNICRSHDSPHGPTKTAVGSGDPNLSNVDAEFNPRNHRQYVESQRTREMLLYVLERYGHSLPFHQFKRSIQLKRGEVAEAFVLLDSNMDGILTKDEVEELPKEKLKKFYSMELDEERLKEATGFVLNDEEEDGELAYSDTILSILNRALNEMETEHGAGKLPLEKLKSLVGKMVHDGVEVELDTEFIFKILDRGGKGYISSQDIEATDVTGFSDDPKNFHLRPNQEEDDDEPEGVAMARKQVFLSSIPYPSAVRGVINALVVVRATLGSQQLDPPLIGHHEL